MNSYLIEADDLVATVVGSKTLREFDEELIQQCLISALDAPAEYTISQILAEDWGHNARQVLGLVMKHADGSLTKTGGKVIKNVSGYDLSKIYIGSNNSLAYIESASLRLYKLPTKTCSFEIALERVDLELICFVHEITTMDFDDSCDACIDWADTSKLRISFNANSDELLELKQKRMKTRLEEFGLTDFKIELKAYSKEYPGTGLRLECHTVLSELLPLAESLGSCSIFPKRGYLFLDHIPERAKLQDCFCYLYGSSEELKVSNNSETELLKQLKSSLRGVE